MNSLDDVIEQIKERADIVSIVGQSVTLKKKGRRMAGLCPFHDEKTPSFYIQPEGKRFKCFGCGVGGDVIDFIMLKLGLPWKDAVRHLAEELRIPVDQSPSSGLPPKKFAKLAKPKEIVVDEKEKWVNRDRCLLNLVRDVTRWGLNSERKSPFMQWAQKKNITVSTIRRLNIQMSLGLLDNGSMAFFYPDGAIKVRRDINDSHSSYWAQGKPYSPWLLESIGPVTRTIYLCEGESDAMRLMGCEMDSSLDAVMSIPSASWTPEFDQAYWLGGHRTVIMCFDGDTAGRTATQRIGEIFKKHGKTSGLFFLNMPEGEDISSLEAAKLKEILASPLRFT